MRDIKRIFVSRFAIPLNAILEDLLVFEKLNKFGEALKFFAVLSRISCGLKSEIHLSQIILENNLNTSLYDTISESSNTSGLRSLVCLVDAVLLRVFYTAIFCALTLCRSMQIDI